LFFIGLKEVNFLNDSMREIKLTIRIPELLEIKKFIKLQVIKIFKRTKEDIINKKVYTVLLIVIFGLLFWKFAFKVAILWTIFWLFLFYNWEDRVLAGIALVLLVGCPIFLITGRKVIAEQIAIYAYYFIVMTVALQIAKLCGLDRRIRLHI